MNVHPRRLAIQTLFLGLCLGAIIGKEAVSAPEKTPMKFDFGAGSLKPGWKRVTPETKYTLETGFGWLEGTEIPVSGTGTVSSPPFTFAVNLPEGNYDVTLVLGSSQSGSETTVRAESRRLLAEKMTTAPGQRITRTFTLNVRTPLLKSGGTISLKGNEKDKRDWDGRLTLDFSGAQPAVDSVEIRPAPKATTLYLAGDSTVTDQEEAPWSAWGQVLPSFFKSGIAVANHAQSGESLHSFTGERRLEKILETLRAGDYLFIQFAHNDQKTGASYADPFTTYTERLKDYIRAARERKAIPILVTSMHRRRFNESGHIVPTLGDYPEAMRRLARAEKVGLIDLNSMSQPLFESMGVEGSKRAFVHYPANSFPNQKEPLHDDTHFSEYGAYELARCVVQGIRETIPDLARFLNKETLSTETKKL